MSKLPTGWIDTQLGELLTFKYGKALPDRIRSGAGFPVYGSNGQVGLHEMALTNGETIVVGRKGSVGEVHFSAAPCSPIDTTYYVDAFARMPARYWVYQLRKLQLRDLNKSTAIPGLNREDAYRLEIQLPPVSEQKRIADKLDITLAKVDACSARLDRVPLILQRFREAVLEAAVSGRLTEEWRGSNDGSPSVWRALTVGDVAEVIDPNPSHRYPSYKDGTVPLLATEQMAGIGGWNISKAELATEEFWSTRMASHGFRTDDVIFARKGRLGLARFPPSIAKYVFSHTVFIVRAKASVVSPEYILWTLRRPKGVEWLLKEMNSNTGVPTLGKAFMLRLPIRVPTLREQTEIVRRVEALFVFADILERKYEAAVKRVEQLTPSVLAKAFRGELVPQDPNDEPAEMLLERIRAERERAVPVRLKAKKSGAVEPVKTKGGRRLRAS